MTLNNSQTIFLNGHHYDALTGKIVKDIAPINKKATHPTIKPSDIRRPVQHKTIDGFINASKNSLSKKSHLLAPHINRTTDKSKTLMREAVKNPTIKKIIKQQHVASNKINHVVERSNEASAPLKAIVLAHARTIQNSEFVSRVNALAIPANPIRPNPNVLQTSTNSEVHLKNLEKLSKIEANPDIDELLSEASLRLEDSHEPLRTDEIKFYQKFADKLRMSVKMLFILSLSLFVLIFGITLSFVFSNNISMYIADSKTNIHGILPTYIPSGYDLSKVTYSTGNPSGTIALHYQGPKTIDTYTIQEQATTWDTKTLVGAVVQPYVGNNFKTYQVGGRTVFYYNNTAVWIDAGIYYTLNNHGNLTPKQINQIVNTT